MKTRDKVAIAAIPAGLALLWFLRGRAGASAMLEHEEHQFLISDIRLNPYKRFYTPEDTVKMDFDITYLGPLPEFKLGTAEDADGRIAFIQSWEGHRDLTWLLDGIFKELARDVPQHYAHGGQFFYAVDETKPFSFALELWAPSAWPLTMWDHANLATVEVVV